jgi:hypothetical protein
VPVGAANNPYFANIQHGDSGARDFSFSPNISLIFFGKFIKENDIIQVAYNYMNKSLVHLLNPDSKLKERFQNLFTLRASRRIPYVALLRV